MRALAADPSQWRYGYDLVTEVGLKSGSLYPILVRLADRGLLDATWEPGPEGRPPRHLYRLSVAGREYVAALPVAAQPGARAKPGREPTASARGGGIVMVARIAAALILREVEAP
jgi:DNA-binding PadR family transcriptional regulator